MIEATPQYGAPYPTFERTVEERILGMPAAGFFGFRFEAVEPASPRSSNPTGASSPTARDSSRASSAPWPTSPPGRGRIPAAARLGERHRRLHTVENVAPGVGEELVERGRVVKPGRTLTVVGVEVHAAGAGRETLCAPALVTFRNLPPSIIR